MSARIVYAGTPEFAVPALRRLHASGAHIVAVYTQPDRPAGRGHRLQPSPVKQLALELGIEVEQPLSLRSEEALARLHGYAPDLLVVVAYGLLLPRPVLALPRHGCINVHASLLPRWRGAAPIQRAILAGDTETGVSIMSLVPKLDAGPVYLQRRCSILPRDTTGTLQDRLAELGAEALLEALPGIVAGSLPAEAQDPAHITHAAKLDKAEAELDWSLPAAVLERAIRAYDPWPVAHTSWQGQSVRLWRAEVIADSVQQPPGTVLQGERRHFDVATGAGVLRILELQLPGGRRMTAQAFLAAQDPRGTRLG